MDERLDELKKKIKGSITHTQKHKRKTKMLMMILLPTLKQFGALNSIQTHTHIYIYVYTLKHTLN